MYSPARAAITYSHPYYTPRTHGVAQYAYLHTYLLTSTHLCIPDSMLVVKSAFEFSAAISAWLTASHPNSEVKQV